MGVDRPKTRRRERTGTASTRIPPWWFIPFATATHQLQTPLSVPDCEARLRTRTLLWWDTRRLDHREQRQMPVLGLVNAKGFAVTSSEWSRNFYHPEARGRFVSTPSGTRVEVHVGEHPLLVLMEMAFFGCWLAAMLWVIVDQQEMAFRTGMFLGVGFVWLVIRTLLLWCAAHDPAFLIGFLRETLQAEPTDENG